MNTLLDIALQEYGVTEIPGIENNPRIMQYAREIGYGDSVLSEKTSWCSIWLIWCAMKAGVERSDKLDARSWLKIGKKITCPELGDIVIYWRVSRDDWRGHTGIFIKYTENRNLIYTLGGNQNNSVRISTYPVSRLLGFRRLPKINT